MGRIKGFKHSEEAKKKMKERKLKNPTNYWLGKKRPEVKNFKNFGFKKGLKHTEEFKENASKLWLKENNPNWRGGVSGEYSNRLKSVKWTETRKRVLERDGYKCNICNSINNLIIHHKIPWHISKNDNDENLIVLCRNCHPTIEREYYINNEVIYN